MPNVSGEDLLETIREAGLDTDVLMVSGAGSIALAVEAMKHGACSFLEKPFTIDTLKREVRAIFTARVGHRTSPAASAEQGPQRAILRCSDRLLGRYEVRHNIGEGGMGCVYEAFDPELKRTVAIKMMRQSMTPGFETSVPTASSARCG